MKGEREQIDLKVVAEEDTVVLVFPRPMDHICVPWQAAYEIGRVMECAANDVPNAQEDGWESFWQTCMFRIAKQKVDGKGSVIVAFPWNDRIRLVPSAAITIGRGIRAFAQDLQWWEQKRILMVYENGHPVPHGFPGPKTVFGPK